MTNYRKACFIEALQNVPRTKTYCCTARAISILINEYGYRFSDEQIDSVNYKRSQAIFDVLDQYVKIDKKPGTLIDVVTSFGIPKNICTKFKEKAKQIVQDNKRREENAREELETRISELF